MITRISFTNPISTDVELLVSGNAFIVESAPSESSPGSTTRINIDDGANPASGIPTINRLKAVFAEPFTKLIISANSGATSSAVYIIVFDTEEIDINIPA